MEISREWSRATASGDVDAIVNYWAEDAVVMMAGLPTFAGKDEIRSYIAESFETPGFAIQWEPLEAHVSASGDLGYILERSEVTLPDAAGRLVTHHSRAVTIRRKSAGQKWRNVVDISNALPDPRSTGLTSAMGESGLVLCQYSQREHDIDNKPFRLPGSRNSAVDLTDNVGL
jgi:ketosteroid isomerase-like protein